MVSSIRSLCIKNNYFTAGSIEQYDTMFTLALDKKVSDHTIATIITICSNYNGDFNGFYEKVKSEITEIRRNYFIDTL